MEDIIKTVQSIEDSGLLLGTLGASLLQNFLTG